jgi:hypothetical protein
MARPKRSEMMRLQEAREARGIVDEELAAISPPSLKIAAPRAAARLGISTRTLFNRLADVPAEPTPEAIGAALVKLAGSGLPGTRGLDSVLAGLKRYVTPGRIRFMQISEDEMDKLPLFAILFTGPP